MSEHPDGSVLAEVADAWNEAYAQGERLLLWIPTWHGKLFARFEVLNDDEEVERLAELAADEDDLIFKSAWLAAACTGVFAVDGQGTQHEVLDGNGQSVTIGADLANRLRGKVEGIDTARSERDVLMCLTRQNGGAIRRLYAQQGRWELDTSQEVEGALVGESLAGVRSTRSPVSAD